MQMVKVCADKQNEPSRCADKLTNKIRLADMLPRKVKGAHLLAIKTNSDVEKTDNDIDQSIVYKVNESQVYTF